MRKNVFAFGGEGSFENNNYIQPDLMSLEYVTTETQNDNCGQLIETGEHLDCDEFIEPLIRFINDDNNNLPVNILIEASVYN
jgi:hypothetical protein